MGGSELNTVAADLIVGSIESSTKNPDSRHFHLKQSF